jgi:DNA repair ATPase RecN
MKIRFIVYIMLIMVVLSFTGCSGTWRKKFVRAKKGEEKEGPILQPYDYAREFTNNQLYANNYTFWRNSESELIKAIKSKDNAKRIRNNAGYAITDINKLSSLLVDEKAAQLQQYIAELEDVIEKIQQPNYVSSNSNTLVSRLSKHYRAVSRDFSYRRMKDFIKPDTDKKEKAEDASQQ